MAPFHENIFARPRSFAVCAKQSSNGFTGLPPLDFVKAPATRATTRVISDDTERARGKDNQLKTTTTTTGRDTTRHDTTRDDTGRDGTTRHGTYLQGRTMTHTTRTGVVANRDTTRYCAQCQK
jgi:hypothetical protein